MYRVLTSFPGNFNQPVMKYYLCLLVFLYGCSSSKEIKLGFEQPDMIADRLFPIEVSDSDTIIRIWIQNSRSVNRVITAEFKSEIGYSTLYTEFGYLYRKTLFGTKRKSIFRQRNVFPDGKSEDFLNQLHALKPLNLVDEKNFDLGPHDVISFYFVEVKYGASINKFQFNQHLPDTSANNSVYGKIARLAETVFHPPAMK